MSKINWGILGYGAIAKDKMIPALKKSTNAKLYAIASKSQKIDSEDGLIVYDDYSKLLKDPNVDIVYISLPNSLHVYWAKEALKAKKHVLCEKPIALSSREIEELKKLSLSVNKVVIEGFMYRYTKKLKSIKELIDSNTIGSIIAIRSHFNSLNSRASGIRADLSLGGGSLWDLGVYPLNFFHFIKPEMPKIIQSVGKKLDSGVDKYLAGNLLYKDGSIFSFSCGWVNDMREMETTIVGTKGKITVGKLYHSDADTVKVITANNEKSYSIEEEDAFLNEAEALMKYITTGKGDLYSLDESIEVLKLAEQVLQNTILI